MVTENKSIPASLSPKDQERLEPPQKKSFAQRMGVAGKTPWDLVQLLLIPLMLAAVGFGFTYWQNQTNLQIAQNNREKDFKIAAANRDQDQRIANNNQEEATLKAYIDDMTNLILAGKLESPSAPATLIARVKTLTALKRLTDGGRKATVIQFLYESKLIGYIDPPSNPPHPRPRIVDLSGADLSSAELVGTNLFGANLRGVYLRTAILRGAKLSCTSLGGGRPLCAILQDADLIGADLRGADLRGAALNSANLSGADLSCTNLSNGQPLCANLSDAILSGADLHGAILSGANLSGTNLSGANLSGAKVTQAQLNEAKSLQGATLPDGSKHP